MTLCQLAKRVPRINVDGPPALPLIILRRLCRQHKQLPCHHGGANPVLEAFIRVARADNVNQSRIVIDEKAAAAAGVAHVLR